MVIKVACMKPLWNLCISTVIFHFLVLFTFLIVSTVLREGIKITDVYPYLVVWLGMIFFFFLSDFKCNSWHPQEKFGYARELSFQHPIKIYLGMLLLLLFLMYYLVLLFHDNYIDYSMAKLELKFWGSQSECLIWN